MQLHHAAALLVAFFLIAPPLAALAQTFPALTGRVVDQANLLKPEERAALEAKLKAHEDKTSDQVVVATISSLEGAGIEDYANRLFRSWKLGDKNKNNGVLLLVAPKERKVRIEVGYGLEGVLTDAVSRLAIDVHITPKFRSNDFAGGIGTGVEAVLSVLQAQADQLQALVSSSRQNDTALAQAAGRLEPAIGEGVGFAIAPDEEEYHWLDPRLWAQTEFSRSPLGGFLLVFIFLLAAIVIPQRYTSGGSRSGGSSSSNRSSSFSGRGGSSGGGGASGSW